MDVPKGGLRHRCNPPSLDELHEHGGRCHVMTRPETDSWSHAGSARLGREAARAQERDFVVPVDLHVHRAGRGRPWRSLSFHGLCLQDAFSPAVWRGAFPRSLGWNAIGMIAATGETAIVGGSAIEAGGTTTAAGSAAGAGETAIASMKPAVTETASGT